jgi:hypothetical protein
MPRGFIPRGRYIVCIVSSPSACSTRLSSTRCWRNPGRLGRFIGVWMGACCWLLAGLFGLFALSWIGNFLLYLIVGVTGFLQLGLLTFSREKFDQSRGISHGLFLLLFFFFPSFPSLFSLFPSLFLSEFVDFFFFFFRFFALFNCQFLRLRSSSYWNLATYV